MTFREFRDKLIAMGLKERPIKDFSIVPPTWNLSSSGLCWERFLPPGKTIRVSIPDLPDDEEMKPEELLSLCLKLRVAPKNFGLPWN